MPDRVRDRAFPPTTSATTCRAVVEAIDAVRSPTPVPRRRPGGRRRSPDGTGELADELAREHDWVHVLHRPGKQGLGQAYVAGFRWALERDYSHILEMDCDLSPPARRRSRACSRRPTTPTWCWARATSPAAGWSGWPAHRRVISRGGSLYARTLLGVGGARSHRRLQVLPPVGARGARPRLRCTGRATSSRSS